jgi:hypothetical protein
MAAKLQPLTPRGLFAAAEIISDASEDLRLAYDICSVARLQEVAEILDSIVAHLLRTGIADTRAAQH